MCLCERRVCCDSVGRAPQAWMWRPRAIHAADTLNLARKTKQSTVRSAHPNRGCCCCCCWWWWYTFQHYRCCGVFAFALIVAPFLILPFAILRVCTCIPIPHWLPSWSRIFFNRTAPTADASSGEDIQDLHASSLPPVETPNDHWLFPFAADRPRIIFFGRNNNPCVKDTPGMDVFDPSKPTMLYIHGYEPGTTARGFRETLDTPTGVFFDAYPVLRTGNVWIDRGYNIGMFYWNQFSDEPDIRDAEKKIYCHGPHRCAIKSSREDSGNGPETVFWSQYGDAKTPGIGQQLCDEYEKYFGDEGKYNGKVTVVGHSMGGQLAIEVSRLLLAKRPSSSDSSEKSHRSFGKLVVLDPFFSNSSVARRATESLEQLSLLVPIETQVTSLVGEGWLSSYCSGLKAHTMYRYHSLPDLCWMDVKSRHCIAHHVFMCDVVEDDPVIHHDVKDKDVKKIK